MKLMPKSVAKALEKHPLYSTINGSDAEVIVRYFNPCGTGTWLITEGSLQENGDWLLYGCALVNSDLWEWGYFLLSELESVRLPFGLRIERDLYLTPGTTVIKEMFS